MAVVNKVYEQAAKEHVFHYSTLDVTHNHPYISSCSRNMYLSESGLQLLTMYVEMVMCDNVGCCNEIHTCFQLVSILCLPLPSLHHSGVRNLLSLVCVRFF